MTLIKQSKFIFKHDCKFTGYGNSTPYLYYKDKGYTDGSGRNHVNLYGCCDICGKEILLAKIHVKENGELYNREGI